ncbi:hypothetical protein JHK85_012563 [Glycine max]|nr:hypothetical protein JHK85_012563 [Glycine max]
MVMMGIEFIGTVPFSYAYLHGLIRDSQLASASYDKFFFGEVGRETYDFFWVDFADWYVSFLRVAIYVFVFLHGDLCGFLPWF